LKPVDAIVEQHREIRKIERGRLFRKYFLLILALVCGAPSPRCRSWAPRAWSSAGSNS